jgi:3,4-dihydroxy 2-butanone 4-phosphate synthase/GTP cyclohydrolase II
MSKTLLNTIEEAIASIKRGEIIIVVDDEDRENEGDFVAAAEVITPRENKFYGHPRKRVDLYSTDRKKM